MTNELRVELVANGLMIKIVVEYFGGKCTKAQMGEIAVMIQDALQYERYLAYNEMLG